MCDILDGSISEITKVFVHHVLLTLGRMLLLERSNLIESHWSNKWLTNFSYLLKLFVVLSLNTSSKVKSAGESDHCGKKNVSPTSKTLFSRSLLVIGEQDRLKMTPQYVRSIIASPQIVLITEVPVTPVHVLLADISITPMHLLLEHHVHCVGGTDVSCENLRAVVKDHESYAVTAVSPVYHTGAIRVYGVGPRVRTIQIRDTIQ